MANKIINWDLRVGQTHNEIYYPTADTKVLMRSCKCTSASLRYRGNCQCQINLVINVCSVIQDYLV